MLEAEKVIDQASAIKFAESLTPEEEASLDIDFVKAIEDFIATEDTVVATAPQKASSPLDSEVVKLGSQEGPKPFKYTFISKDGFKTIGAFPRYLNQQEIDEIANYMDLGEGYTYEQSIDTSPDVMAQYIAQKGGSTAEINNAYSMPRMAKQTVEELGGADVSTTRKVAGVTGDLASSAGRVFASTVGEIADFATGNDSESFASRLSRTGANPRQNIGVKVIEDLVRDPSLPLTMGGANLISKTKYVPGIGDYLSTQALSTPLKQVGLGAATGTGAVAVTDALNDYALDEDRITGTDYALGGLGGVLMPSVQKGVKELAMGIKPNAPSELSRIDILPKSRFGDITERVESTLSPEAMLMIKDDIFDPASRSLKFTNLISGKLKNADAENAKNIAELSHRNIDFSSGSEMAQSTEDFTQSIMRQYGQQPRAGILESVIDRASYKYPEYAQKALDVTYNPLAEAYQKSLYPFRQGMYKTQEKYREGAGSLAGTFSSSKMPYLGMIGTDLAEGHYEDKSQEIQPTNFIELMNQRYLNRGN